MVCEKGLFQHVGVQFCTFPCSTNISVDVALHKALASVGIVVCGCVGWKSMTGSGY